jgi:succinyl-diaminopimelate desuccinylase
VLNGHIDTFPVAGRKRWTRDPLGGEIADGRVFGTGSSDMKQGTASLVAAFTWLHAMRDQLAGRMTLTAVSDEETFGPNGARFLVEHHAAEVLGDCLLNAEPGAPTTLRFAEKAPLWIAVEVQTMGCHGAYTHKSPSATKIAAAVIEDLASWRRCRWPSRTRLPPRSKPVPRRSTAFTCPVRRARWAPSR